MSTPQSSGRWSGDTETKPAPEPLRRVQALVNTVDLESGQDRLALAADAGPWLVDHALLTPGATPTEEELRLVVGVREGLRALLIQNAGGDAPNASRTAPLTEIAAATPVRAAIDDDGRISLVPDGESVRSRLVSLLLLVKDAQLDGTWSHLKACANDDCAWAFYDRSRNHGGMWCDMAACGNKLKNRDFRARRRQPLTR